MAVMIAVSTRTRLGPARLAEFWPGSGSGSGSFPASDSSFQNSGPNFADVLGESVCQHLCSNLGNVRGDGVFFQLFLCKYSELCDVNRKSSAFVCVFANVSQ